MRQQLRDGAIENRLSSILLKKWLPHIVVIIWLIFLGATIWSHAKNSQQPPIYDPLSYFQKAKTFWENIDRGKWVNPLNIEPTVRPPGTILMTFPFGYSSNFHGFHFRSVYLPIVCVVIAVYMSIGLSRALAVGWGVAGVALLFSSLPLFYHFEWVENIQTPVPWGLVDNFQAGIAALAAAAIVRSLTTGSQRWLCLGGMLGSFTLLVKPSGLMAMALLGVTWFMLAMWGWWKAQRNTDFPLDRRRYLIYGTLQLFIIFLIFVISCVSSKYLSPANLGYAKQALVLMKEVLAIPLSYIPTLVHPSIGEVLIIWTLVIIILYGCNPYCRSEVDDHVRSPKTLGLLMMAALVWAGGVWYWLVVQAGGSQIRYFFPFALIGFIYLVPMAIQVWQHAKAWARTMILLICILPAVNMACLLIQRNPPVPWQKITGVNISVGTSREEEVQAHVFLKKVRKDGRNANVYSFQSGLAAAIFASVGSYEATIRPDYPTFITRGQIDWTKGFVTRVSDLLSADYVLFRPVEEEAERQRLMHIETIGSFGIENQVFQAWLSGLTEKNGVRVVSETRVRLLEIIDGAQFERDAEQFVSTRSWHADFNKANPRRYWSASEVSSYIKTPLEEEIQFGDLYKLHTLMIRRETEGLKVEIWWEELKHDENNNQRIMFFHLIDAQGNMIHNQQIGLGGYKNVNPNRRWHYDSTTFALPIDPKVKALGFGVYHPDSRIGNLAADKGTRDSSGRRVVVPLHAVK